MTAQVAADLRAAADVLERDGWTQFQFHEVSVDACKHCALGAIASAVTGDFWPRVEQLTQVESSRFHDARLSLSNHLLSNRLPRSVTSFNDAPGRTASEVIAALRAAADVAEADQ
jgi:hypothetical protein